MDWLEYPCEKRADVIVCLQVLEHLPVEKVAAFAGKIVSSGRIAIISVPYVWEKGQCVHHLQGPAPKKIYI